MVPAVQAPSYPGANEVSDQDFRLSMGTIATGVAVVTTLAAGKPQGMTLNSLASVSLNPLLLLIWLTRGSRTARDPATGGIRVQLPTVETRGLG